MSQNFDHLKIDGSFISDLTATPSKRVRLSLFHGPRTETDEQVSLEFDLQFNRVRYFILNIEAKPWMEIVSHRILKESDYLRTCLASEEREDGPNNMLQHFQIIRDEGKIDVIAESFTIGLINKMPHFNTSPNPNS